MRVLAYYVVLLGMAVWVGWVGHEWRTSTRRADAATEARITRTWPPGKRQLELREEVREAQEIERRRISTRLILQGGAGLIVLHLISLGLKARPQ